MNIKIYHGLIFLFIIITIYSSYNYYKYYQKEKKIQYELDAIKRSFEIDNVHLFNEENEGGDD
jgi:hypothetical protein